MSSARIRDGRLAELTLEGVNRIPPAHAVPLWRLDLIERGTGARRQHGQERSAGPRDGDGGDHRLSFRAVSVGIGVAGDAECDLKEEENLSQRRRARREQDKCIENFVVNYFQGTPEDGKTTMESRRKTTIEEQASSSTS